MEAPALRPTPPLIVWMSFRLAIPWRVVSTEPASASPAGTVCCNIVLPVESFSSNGQPCLNCLCQPRGQRRTEPPRRKLSILMKCLGVLLCYNDGDLLADSIAYLREQRHDIVLWDHGSTDNTAEVVARMRGTA